MQTVIVKMLNAASRCEYELIIEVSYISHVCIRTMCDVWELNEM